MNEQQIIEIWETFKDYIQEKSRDTAANQYVDFLLSQDVELEELENVLGYDSHLDQAIELILEENKEEPEEEFEDWDNLEDE